LPKKNNWNRLAGWRRPLICEVCDLPPTEEQELQLLPNLFDPLNKTAAKALGEEKGRAPIHAGSNELQLPRAVGTLVEWHTAAEYTLKKALAEPSPGALRQIADLKNQRSASARVLKVNLH
jgi:hypothetical protein